MKNIYEAHVSRYVSFVIPDSFWLTSNIVWMGRAGGVKYQSF
jgi:hypothetical protein